MRTTIDLPDDTFRDLKSLAAQQGITLKSLLRHAVEQELARAQLSKKPRRLSFPLIDSREPGRLKSLTSKQLDELLT
jgi:hypothetical protein